MQLWENTDRVGRAKKTIMSDLSQKNSSKIKRKCLQENRPAILYGWRQWHWLTFAEAQKTREAFCYCHVCIVYTSLCLWAAGLCWSAHIPTVPGPLTHNLLVYCAFQTSWVKWVWAQNGWPCVGAVNESVRVVCPFLSTALSYPNLYSRSNLRSHTFYEGDNSGKIHKDTIRVRRLGPIRLH